jgi:hypothetical protein
MFRWFFVAFNVFVFYLCTMRNVVISSHRVAYSLNKRSCTTRFKKGISVDCDLIVELFLSNETEYEDKKIFFSQIIDVCRDSEYEALLEKASDNREQMISLVNELQEELLNGEWVRKESEYETLYHKIEHRRKIIGEL